MFSDLTLFGIGAVPIILGIVQVAKETGLPGRLAPLASLALGVGFGIAAQFTLPHPIILQGVVLGSAVGLAASGAYSGIAKMSEPPPA